MLTMILTANPFETVSKPIIDLLNMALTPALGIVGALGAIYCIILGAKLAKAEEPQDREKAKNSLKNGLITPLKTKRLLFTTRRTRRLLPMKNCLGAYLK